MLKNYLNWRAFFNPENLLVDENQLFPCLLFVLREEVDEFFRVMDKDLDGKLTLSEFLGEDSHNERLFKTMDTNNDGLVSKEVNIMKISFPFLRCFSPGVLHSLSQPHSNPGNQDPINKGGRSDHPHFGHYTIL